MDDLYVDLKRLVFLLPFYSWRKKKLLYRESNPDVFKGAGLQIVLTEDLKCFRMLVCNVYLCQLEEQLLITFTGWVIHFKM